MIPQEELEKAARDLEYGDSKTGGREYDAFIAGARYAEEHYLNELKEQDESNKLEAIYRETVRI